LPDVCREERQDFAGGKRFTKHEKPDDGIETTAKLALQRWMGAKSGEVQFSAGFELQPLPQDFLAKSAPQKMSAERGKLLRGAHL
jgi:hypothetical protein